LSDSYSKPAREPGGDPLAELARLIGQSDPFTDTKRVAQRPLDNVKPLDRPAPEWLARPAAPEAEDDYAPAPAPRGGFYEPPQQAYEPPQQAYEPPAYDPPAEEPPVEAPRARRAPVAQPASEPQAYAAAYDDARYAEPQADEYADDRYRVAPPPAQDYDDSYYAEDGHLPPGEDGPVSSRRRGGLITVAAVIGLAVIGTAGAFGYRAYTSGGSSAPAEVPVIKADTKPLKEVPPPAAPAQQADASGKPFQDRVGANGAPDRIVSREEQPVAVPVAPTRSVAPPAAAMAPAASSSTPVPLVAPPASGNVNEPKRVRTMTIRADTPDGTPTASTPVQSAPAAATPRTQSAPAKQSGPMAIAPDHPSSRAKVAARTPAAQAAGGAYVVQVSAQRTEAEARSSYQALQQKYPSVLGSRDPNIRRVDLGDKGGVFYRAQVGSFATAEAANDFCTSLKNAGGQCIVQKN
jgi:hypothetical protein